jgi:UDP-glucuronate decarboxylase
MRILVTGGAGLIGSHLCELLLENDHEVVCADNFKTSSIDNIKTCLKNRNFNLLDLDVIGGKFYIQVDQIYNLASPTAPGHFKLDPIGTIKANVIGTINVLELAKQQKVPVVHVSTMRVLENTNTFDSSACYVEGKRCAETICYEYKKLGVDVKVCRLFNIYGERMRLDDSRVLPQFILKALRNESLPVLNHGMQKDSFCYVKDIVDALIKMMDTNYEYPITLGSRDFISIKDLAASIIDITNSDSQIEFIKDDPNKIFDRSNIPINNLRNWEPETDLKTGLKHMVNYFIEKLKSN